MSQITSNAASAEGARRVDDQLRERAQADPDAAVAQFEGMLFATVLTPLSKELGMLGDVLTDSIATAVAKGTHDQFYEHLESLTTARPAPSDTAT